MLEVVGAIHGHSRYSDGTGTYPEILDAAHGAGLDFLVMTDHDTLAPLEEVGEGFYGRTLLLVGCEVSPPTNHLLTVGARTCPSNRLPPQDYVDDLSRQRALTFLAHPHDRGVPLARLPSYRWDAWPIEGYTGIEIWNHLSAWSGNLRTLPRAVRGVMDPLRMLPPPAPETLALWDEEGRRRRVVGIGGLDVHDVRIGKGPARVRIFPYAYAFRTILCHAQVEQWPEDPDAAKAALLSALALGRIHFANHLLGDARGLRLSALSGDGRELGGMGDEVPSSDVAALTVDAPRDAQITLLRDGDPVARIFGESLRLPAAGPGVYRAELYVPSGRRLMPWAFTNPIYLRSPDV